MVCDESSLVIHVDNDDDEIKLEQIYDELCDIKEPIDVESAELQRLKLQELASNTPNSLLSATTDSPTFGIGYDDSTSGMQISVFTKWYPLRNWH